MELKAILFKRYPALYLCLFLIYGCGQTVDRSNNRMESVPVSPIQTDKPQTEDSVIADSVVYAPKQKVRDKTVDTLSQKTEQKAEHVDDIPMLISAKELRDTLLKTVVLEKDSLMQEKVTLSVLTSAGKAPWVEDRIFVRMYNYSSDTLLTGLSYKVEFFDNGKWIMVSPPKNVGWEDIGYILYPFIARDFPVLLFPDRHTYRPGTYRIVKSPSARNRSGPYRKMEVSAEFEIE